MAPKTLVSPAQCPNRPRELPAVEVSRPIRGAIHGLSRLPVRAVAFVPRHRHGGRGGPHRRYVPRRLDGDRWHRQPRRCLPRSTAPEPRATFQPTFTVAAAAWSPERMAWRSETVNDRRKRSVRSETDRSPRVRGASDRRVAGPVPNRPRLRGERGRGRGQLAPGGLRDGISGRPGHSAD